jgi:hypothetical protein
MPSNESRTIYFVEKNVTIFTRFMEILRGGILDAFLKKYKAGK